MGKMATGRKSLVTKDAGLKDGKVRGADKQKEKRLKGRRVKNNGSWSVCSSLGDKNSSVCGGYSLYMCTQALNSPP